MAQDRTILVQEEPRGPSQLIEIPVTAGKTRVPFPDIQQLRSDQTQMIVIKAMRLIDANVLTNGIINAGANASLTELQKIALVIYCEGWEKGQLIPILTLDDVFTEGSGVPSRRVATRFNNWQNVDWSKSYLQYANGTLSVGTYVVMFDVEYVRMKYNSQLKQYEELTGTSN